MRVKYYQSEIALESTPDKDLNLSCLHPTLQLTERETDILRELAKGMNNKEIALMCGIGETTVKHHLTRIFDKVGVHSRLELGIWAAKNRVFEEGT